jgi:cysteine desulfurase
VVNVSFTGVESEALMLMLREVVAISNGAACTSAIYEPSHVLRAMGLVEERIAEAVRISWGPGVEEIPTSAIVEAVQALRG